MCIFSQPITSVGDTEIFARVTGRGTQYLVYQMRYESLAENAMILPVPVRQPANDGSLRFIDLKDYPRFFSDLRQGFPFYRSIGLGCSAGPAPAVTAALTVFEVGNYIASFVPTLSDFDRLDERFRLPKATWAKLPRYKNFGFAVFQLAVGSLQPHPMAFVFETAQTSVFFPTVHVHDGEVHEQEDFDHVLYLQHAGYDSRVGGYRNSNVRDKSTGLVRSQKVAGEYCDLGKSNGILAGGLLLHRLEVRGNHANEDIAMTPAGDPERPTLNIRPFLQFTPWALLLGAVLWILGRRVKLNKVRPDDVSP